MPNSVEYTGIIKRQAGNKVFVAVERSEGCNSCKAKAICFGEAKDDVVETFAKNGKTYKVGDRVVVTCPNRMNERAMIIAFMIPLMLMVGAIFVTVVLMGVSETVGTITGLALPALWYAALYWFRDKLKDKFVFTIKN